MKNSIKMFLITAGVLILVMSGCYSFSGGRLDFKTVDIPVVEEDNRAVAEDNNRAVVAAHRRTSSRTGRRKCFPG